LLIGRFRFLFPIWVLILIAVSIGIYRSKKIASINFFLNVTSAILITLTLVSISSYLVRSWGQNKSKAENVQVQTSALDNTSPSVYYIIMDSFGREDLLRDAYNVNDHGFITELERLGFVIPSCTQSNYSQTVLSLSSSLNMNYLDSLGLSLTGKINTSDFEPLIKQSAVRHIFEQLGYKTITMKTVYPYLDITDSTYYFDYFQNVSHLGSIESSNFQYTFMMTTVFRPLLVYFEAHSINTPSFISRLLPDFNLLINRNYKQYQQNLFLLDTLENTIPRIQEPKFVYAHLFVTHQPFSFTPAGEFRWPVDDSDEAYRDQILFAEKRLIRILTNILALEKTPPIIILQGDHSYIQNDRRVQILNAYYLPGGHNKAVDADTTPVNTFRVILNEYFGGNYQLLDNISYYSTKETPFNFEKVPATCVNP
jgi:hypothetical protein